MDLETADADWVASIYVGITRVWHSMRGRFQAEVGSQREVEVVVCLASNCVFVSPCSEV